MRHILNYGYYVRKNELECSKPYGDVFLQKPINDLEENQLAAELRSETLKRSGIGDLNDSVSEYFSEYAVQKLVTRGGEFLTEAFSDYSDANAEYIFMELLRERMK